MGEEEEVEGEKHLSLLHGASSAMSSGPTPGWIPSARR